MTAVLRTHQLSLSFGRFRAVDDLCLTVRQGEIYGFLGRNGAGKTTTIRMMMGVIKPDAGDIELDGWRGRRIGVRQKRRIGYVSQQQFFYPWMTCRALGRFVGGFYPTWDRQEFARLLAWLDLPPDRKVAHLSGGMQVKLALALALAHRPPLLILDEPTSGLDPVARREFLEIIRHQARHDGRTTFFSSHLIDEVERVADRVGIIHQGKLRYEGAIPALQEMVREVLAAPEPPTLLETETAVVEPETSVAVQRAAPLSPELKAQDEPTLVVAERVDATVLPTVEASAALPSLPVAAAADPKRELAAWAAASGLTVLREGFDERPSLILAGSQEAWRQAPLAPERIRPLSLEDVFIALAGEVQFGPAANGATIAR